MSPIFSGHVVYVFILMLLVSMGSNLVIAGEKDCNSDKWKDHPICTGTDPEPDPDPGSSGAACVESGSFFPAFTYVDIRDEDEIFLSNAAGDCTIPVHKADAGIVGVPTHLSYRYFDDSDLGEGIIVWVEYTTDRNYNLLSTEIQLLQFTVENEAIIDPLPITPTLLFQVISGDYDILGVDLSPSGDRVLFKGHVDGNYYIDEIPIDCGNNCLRTRLFETQPDANGNDVHILRPLYSLDGERIYFELGYPDRKLVFIEKDADGKWPILDYDSSTDRTMTSEPILILSHEDGDRGAGAIGYWDYNGDGTAQEVIAHPRELFGYDTIEILDVEACLATNPPGGNECVVIGSRSTSGIVIAGRSPSFTNLNNDHSGLLYTFQASKTSGVALQEFNLDTLTEHTLIKAVKGRNSAFIGGVDAAD